ncbi:MAG: cytochrome c1 [Pseudomonadota bacterium]
MTFRKLIAGAALAALLPAAPAVAAGGGGEVTDFSFSFEGPLGGFDEAQLQRGFQVFNEVCSACHGLRYVSFRALGEAGGPGYDAEQVKAFAEFYEVPDTSEEALPGDTRPALPSDKFPANDSVNAPDLSLMAKGRAGFHGPMGTGISQLFNGIGGPEYIASLLLGYNGDEKEQGGAILYGNDVYSTGYINMAPPLDDDLLEYADGTPATKEQMAKDVAAFLMWTSEPKLEARKAAGARNFVFIGLLAVLLYLTNKKLWAGIKKKGVVPAE